MSRYNDYNDYNEEGNRPTNRNRRINFDNSDFESDEPSRGQRDRDWSDDFDTRDDGRVGSRRPVPRRASSPRRSNASSAANHTSSSYRDDDDYGYSDDYNERTPMLKQNFRQRHPVLMNFVYIVIAGVVLLWMLMWFLDYWTAHGEERVVPDVKGQTYDVAAGNVDLSGLRVAIADSVFDSYSRPGTIVEQVPIPGAKIKKGGTVYLTIVAFSPKLVTVPDFYNVSVRQARSMFEGIGIKDIRQVSVVSEYAGLVLGAKFNGVSLQPGARIPVSSVVTLEVGSGWTEEVDSGANVDENAIDNAINELNIEELNIE
jgi:hypothetical protein